MSQPETTTPLFPVVPALVSTQEPLVEDLFPKDNSRVTYSHSAFTSVVKDLKANDAKRVSFVIRVAGDTIEKLEKDLKASECDLELTVEAADMWRKRYVGQVLKNTWEYRDSRLRERIRILETGCEKKEAMIDELEEELQELRAELKKEKKQRKRLEKDRLFNGDLKKAFK